MGGKGIVASDGGALLVLLFSRETHDWELDGVEGVFSPLSKNLQAHAILGMQRMKWISQSVVLFFIYCVCVCVWGGGGGGRERREGERVCSRIFRFH